MPTGSPQHRSPAFLATACAVCAGLLGVSCGVPPEPRAEIRETVVPTELVAPVVAKMPDSSRSFLTVAEFHDAVRSANPGYSGRAALVTDAARRVVQANLAGCGLRRLEPFADMALEVLDLSDNPVEDLAPLRGMPLRILLLDATRVADLEPLAGMKLEQLSLVGTPVEDLRPLMQSQIIELDLRRTRVSDLAPLAVMPVEELRLDGTRVLDLSALASCPLRVLTVRNTPVRDLAPLAGRPLHVLDIAGTGVTDVTPLAKTQLQRLFFTRERIRSGLGELRALRSLREIGDPQHSYRPAPQYWQDTDAK